MSKPFYSQQSAKVVSSLKNELGQGIILQGPVGIGLGYAAQDIAHHHSKEVINLEPDAKGTIGIDAIRELYTLGRSKGTVTVFIINDADAMGREAQNALLKLLEEPVSSLHFILTSHTPERLLQTIRSRVAPYSLTPISAEQTKELLATLKVSDTTKLAQLSFIASGLPAALTRYAGDNAAFATRSATVRDARSFLQGSREERLLVSAQYKDRSQTIQLLSDMMKLLRRSIEASPSLAGSEALESLISSEAALQENASVRLSLTALALAL